MTGKFKEGQILVLTNRTSDACSGRVYPAGTVVKTLSDKDHDDEYYVQTKDRNAFYARENNLDITSPKEKASFKS
jgi:hypothetical protein